MGAILRARLLAFKHMRRPSVRFLGDDARRIACRIAERIAARGARAWIVGGSLRDLALGGTPEDVDMASALPPEQLADLFERTVEVGKAFGTVVVHLEGHDVQVTTFRTETGYSDRRRPDRVEWGTSVEEDAARRDFTVNALYLDPLADELADPEGGLADLEARRLRCVGEPARRFREDGLRLLRLGRFAAGLDFEVEQHTLEAARAERHALAGVSGERVAEELRRVLARPRARRAFELFDDLGLLDEALPGVVADPAERALRWRVLGRLEPAPGFEEGLILLAEVGSDGGRDAAAGFERLHLSREESRTVARLGELLAALRTLPPDAGRATRVRLVRDPLWPRAARLARALFAERGAAEADPAPLLAFAASLAPGDLSPAPFVTSDDLARSGLPRGPQWGRVLEEAESLQLEGELASREAALAWLAGRVAASLG
ncbi:MAG TPA: CCA tRNA nucleotidyltransferase [Planctomycetota bacterium]|nr:CCA tRNA nucleotidyltransferase [Planctomycetota bacterium]